MERQESDSETARRWTCEACGCNTNSQSDRTCSICGSSGPSLLRRAGYTARSGLFARGFAARRGIMNEDIDDLWDRVVDGVEMAGPDEDEHANASLALEVAGSSARSRETGRQSILDAARTFSLANRESPAPDPEELLQAATENAMHYRPKWGSLSQLAGRVNSGNGIEVGDGERQNVAHLPLGAGEGRAVRALEAIPKSVPFSSFSMPSPSNRNQERRHRRAFGFRVAFDHARREVGSSMGGCYLVGVTTSSFAAFGERNGLQQSPFFWGIEDGGNKYEGSRYNHSSRASRRGPSNFAIEVGADEAPCNSDSVLFGCREVVTVVVDFESRTLTFWRDSQLLGTLVSNLPRSGNLYPVAVPFNAGVTVAITGMEDDPLQLLQTFASGWKQAQQQKDEESRRILAAQRSVLIFNGRPTLELLQVLNTIFSWYSGAEIALGNKPRLSYVAAARMWYRCGLKLSYIDSMFEGATAISHVTCDDFLGLIQRIISDDENWLKNEIQLNRQSDTLCEVGDKVELVEGFERFGDACSGPLQPGDRGTVVELQQGNNGERHSVRVLYSGRRWWYQPQALMSEKSRLIETPAVWFLRKILRSHGFDHTTLQPLWGKPVTTSSWLVGDIVVPRRAPPQLENDTSSSPIESCVGRIVGETSSSSSSLAAKGRESGMVLVEFIDEAFGEATGASTGSSLRESSQSLDTCRIRVNRLLHSSIFHGSSVLKRGVSGRSVAKTADVGDAPPLSISLTTTTATASTLSSPSAATITTDSTTDTTTEATTQAEIAKARNSNSSEVDHSVEKNNDCRTAACSLNAKLRADIEAIAKLDLAAIESVTKECKKNASTLVNIFSSGLPDEIIAAIECAEEKLKTSDVHFMSQSITALGVLSELIVEQLFAIDSAQSMTTEDEIPDTEDHSLQQYSASYDDGMDESAGNTSVVQQHAASRFAPSDAISIRLGDRGFAQDANLSNRISTLQYRRNYLLALMSRARRSNTNSLNDFVERENGRFPGDISLSQIMPPYGPFRQGAAGRPFLFGQQNELLYDGNWDELEGFPGGGSQRFAENTNDASVESRRGARRTPSPNVTRTRNGSSAFLCSILQGQGETVTTHQSQGNKGTGQSHSMKCLIQNGLLGDSPRWVSAVMDAQNRRGSSKSNQGSSAILKNLIDEDGVPILLLAISLGCSGSVLNYLIQCGSSVGTKELRKAAWTNQPQALSILLQHAVYSDGMINLNICSPEVVKVVCEARTRQDELSRKMRVEAGAFIVQLLRKLLVLGLQSRQRRISYSNTCSQAISGVLVGNVLLRAMQRTQHSTRAGTASDTPNNDRDSVQRDPSVRASISDEKQFSPDLQSSSKGLVGATPREILSECLFSSTSHITQYLLLVEDYLCSKEIGDGAIGLTLLSSILKKFPFLSSSSEMERYGITELVNSHDVIASSRLAEILSRQLPEHNDAPSNVMGVPLEQSPNVDPSNLSLTGCVMCPKKHMARLHITRHSSFRCDLCGKGVERGRPMHGCRECDWDACEECTDKAEGGFVKCSHVKELALECQQLLSRGTQENDLCSLEVWEEGILEKLQSQNNSSDLNRLSIRLLQRDSESIKELAEMLKIPGRITVHQFVSVILPSLHASLLGRSSENDRFCSVFNLGSGHRSKKPRVVSGSFRDIDVPSEGHPDGRTAFCRHASTYLISEDADDLIIRRSSKGINMLQGSNEYSDMSLGHDTDNHETDEVDEGSDKKGRCSGRSPEVLRRLHQVLSLYETVTLVSKSSQLIHQSNGGTSAGTGTLQALTQPVEISLCPAAFEHERSVCHGLSAATIRAEPLISFADLEIHVLRICRLNHPSYLSFCRRLAKEKSIIVERCALRGKHDKGKERTWRLAQVMSFDELSGSHSVRYASCWKHNTASKRNVIELRGDFVDSLCALQYEEKETCMILAAREYYILHRARGQGESASSKSAFNMARLLSDGMVPETEENTRTDSLGLTVGSRVESNCASLDGCWQVFTVIAVDPDCTASGGEGRFVLVSDSGQVFSGVSPDQVRSVDRNKQDGQIYHGERRNNVEGHLAQAGRRSSALDRGSRAFPFLTSRQHLSARRESQDFSSGSKRSGALKRTWSALSLIESMCPIELSSPLDQDSVRHDIITDGIVWSCNLGDSELDIVTENSLVEAPPQIRVEFSAHENRPTVDVSLNQNLTLMGALKHLYGRDDSMNDNYLIKKVHRLFYSVVLGFDAQAEKEALCSGSFPSSGWEGTRVPKQGCEEETFSTPRRDLMKPGFTPSQENMSITARNENCSWPPQESRSRKLSVSPYFSDDERSYRGICEGLGEICVQCLEVIGLLSEFSVVPEISEDKSQPDLLVFENGKLSSKLMEQLEDPLTVVGGALPVWCEIAPMFAPRVFSYESRRLLLERSAFGVSRSALKQQEAKVNVGRLRQRMADLRARAVELVGEAFSGGAEDPTALQLQADELYGMEEALAARVKAAFRAERWEEHSLQVAKAAVRREKLLIDAATVMHKYANDENVCQRRLEVRFENESGFDAASGDEAGVTRGFYADVAEALLNCDNVAGVLCSTICPVSPAASIRSAGLKYNQLKLPIWIPDIDSSGQVVIPTPRADPRSGLGVYPRPLSPTQPQMQEVLVRFRFIGRLFAAALRDGFMFPLPLSSSFLKLVQHGSDGSTMRKFGSWSPLPPRNSLFLSNRNESSIEDKSTNVSGTRDTVLTSLDLPRPGFLGGEVYGVEVYICRALDRLEEADPPLSRYNLDKQYQEIATNKNFARVALGKSYDCSFEDYFQDRTFVDPLDPTQGEEAAPLCPNGHKKPVTIYNVREWVALAKQFILHDGVIAQALAFRCGVADFFFADYLRLFTSEELQRDVCGVGDKVDTWEESDVRKLIKLDGGKGAAEALVAVAAIGGEGGAALSRRFGPSSPTINFLVKALLEATSKERRQFLSFVTSVPIVTPGRIEVVPMVSPSGEFLPMRDPGCLPRANTCARRLYLPKFETYESFSLVLWAVVREESKFKGFFEWRGS